MAVRFVPCVSKEHAITCREVGLLYINFSTPEMDDDWTLALGCNTEWVRECYDPASMEWPRPSDFGVALEE